MSIFDYRTAKDLKASKKKKKIFGQKNWAWTIFVHFFCIVCRQL
jgi:hypothetical protein